jgi:signal transduction histidine kinase
MHRLGDGHWGPPTLVGLGAGLAALAAAHHVTEVARIGALGGPLVAFVLDGVPALGLGYAGYWLAGTDLDADAVGQVVRWCLLGGVVFLATLGLSMGIRLHEGRPVSEPLFTLLLTAEAGALAGFAAGYYRARALADKRRAEQALDALSFVNGIVRHDLRNDLQVVDASTDLLAAEVATDEGARRVRSIRRSAADARDRLDDTEAIAKTLTADAAFETIDLVDVVSEVVTHVEDRYDVTVETDLPETAPVAGNEGLRSVVDNLLENAVEHTDSEHPRPAVTVEPAGDTVRLVVRDDGPGLPEGARAVLSGTDGDGPVGGLRIVRRLVDEYGGDIRVEDAPGGAAVTVSLPVGTPDAERASAG